MRQNLHLDFHKSECAFYIYNSRNSLLKSLLDFIFHHWILNSIHELSIYMILLMFRINSCTNLENINIHKFNMTFLQI